MAQRPSALPADQVVVPAARPVFAEDDRAEILGMVDEALRGGNLTLGHFTAELEEGFAARHRAAHAVATSSGTSALEIALRTCSPAGGEVVVPTNTFFATAAAVVHAGGRPRFADVAPGSLMVSAETVAAAATSATTGVVVVHIGGTVCPDIEAIQELCEECGWILVEDAAHAHGSELGGQPAGSWGHASAFSFYPTKVITSGEGGMMVTPDADLAAEARVYRDQGKTSFLGGGHVRMGYAWRMSELHAAVGLVQLRRLDEFIAVRQRAAARYDQALAEVDGITPVADPAGSVSNKYKYIAFLDDGVDRTSLKGRLRFGHGVQLSGEVYATPLHREPVFDPFVDAAQPLLAAEDVCQRHVCLPVHSDMVDGEVDAVVQALVEELGSPAVRAG